jgi:hypothetical protein
MDRVSQYRKRAQRSRDLAERAPSGEARQVLQEMARHWDALALLLERSRAAPD